MKPHLPLGEPVVERLGARAQDDDEVDPALGEQVAGVPVEDAPAGLDLVFQGVEELGMLAGRSKHL